MSVREYIGARYVPVFSDPIQWDDTNSYEPLTVVMNQGTSYVSKQSVPAGIEITNETYWLRWADYNAQLEEYIRQVQLYSGRITTLEDAMPIADFDSENTIDNRFEAIESVLPLTEFDSTNTVANAIASNASDITEINGKIGGTFSEQSTVADAITSNVSDITEINGKIGGTFSDQSTVADAIDNVNEKLSTYIDTNDFISFTTDASYSNLYIDSVNGNDENTGFWGHPLKTLDKAIEIVNSNNSSDIYFHFISEGNFTVQNAIINGGQVHFMVNALNSGQVNLTFDTLRAYNCYLHFSSETAGQFELTFNNENHFDACCAWFSGVDIRINSAPNHSYCDFTFFNCSISTAVQIQVMQSRVRFTGTNSITQISGFNSPILFARFSNVLVEGTMNLIFIGDTTHAMMRFDDGMVVFNPSSMNVSKPSNLKYGLTILRSVAIVPPAVSSMLNNHVSDSVFEGYNSIIKNSVNNTVLN